ncbi:hypothetical protein Pelo_17438 [Pelomyxa schiedti]|nr:hypothetical protein Pelo_17438 [Pelomyxa schiedti]
MGAAQPTRTENKKLQPQPQAPPTTSITAPTTNSSRPQVPPESSSPRVTLQVEVPATSQFVAFACGSLVARTRARSPARLLAASPSIVEQFGREWVVCGCRDVVESLIVGEEIHQMVTHSEKVYHQAHLWIRLSPTLGVVRSAQFATTGGFGDLIGHVGTDGVHRKEDSFSCGDRLVLVNNTIMRDFNVVDGNGCVVEQVAPTDSTVAAQWSDSVHINRRWLVIVRATHMSVWRIGGAGGSKFFAEDCCVEIGTSHIRAALNNHHVNVLFVHRQTISDQNQLEMIDLEESFSKGMMVMVAEPIVLPPGNCVNLLCGDPICAVYEEIRGQSVYNTESKKIHTFKPKSYVQCLSPTIIAVNTSKVVYVYELYNTANLNTPCQRITNLWSSRIIMQMQQVGGILVWESEGENHQSAFGQLHQTIITTLVTRRYVITDAVTATRLAVLNYGLTLGQEKVFCFH